MRKGLSIFGEGFADQDEQEQQEPAPAQDEPDGNQ